MFYKDTYGRYEIESEVYEAGKFYQWRKYSNSAYLKQLGGMYANWCEDGRIKFYRNDYIRERAYSKFVSEGGVNE